jgi:cytochrome c oxidase subunit 3
MIEVQEHFEDMEKQAHAARFGMWVFLGSELLFFAGLFALYTTYRVEHPTAFGVGVEHNTLVLGSINTAVLLLSSYTVASGLHALRVGKRGASLALVGATIALGAAFLVIKTTEYSKHFDEGIYPGGVGRFFAEHREPGMPMFWTLYYTMTGLHALHVTVGMVILAFMFHKVRLHQITAATSHPLELGAIYWHLVDLIWIFLWPLFYLIPGGVR